MNENILDDVASRSAMLDLDIKAVMAATGYSEKEVIMGFIVHLEKRLSMKGNIKTEYMYLLDFCKYLKDTGTSVNESDINDYFETRS